MARSSGPGKQKARTESRPAPDMEQIFQDATKVSSLAAENTRLKETNDRGTQDADR